MKNLSHVEGITIPINICSYKTSKSIKIYIKQGYVKITKPYWYCEKQILKYLDDNKEYINRLYEENKYQIRSNSLVKDYLFYLGEKYKINVIQWEKDIVTHELTFESLTIYIPLNIGKREYVISRALDEIYKECTLKYVKMYLIQYCNIMKIPIPNFKIKNCKTIWGSCSSKGNLNFNTKLSMLPPNVIEQIVIHELCHLKHMNHSKEFWNLVYAYCDKEQYIKGHKWIKENIY